jgi:hypothetical protein
MIKMLSLVVALSFAANAAFAADNTVGGHFRGEGKETKLNFVRSGKGDSYDKSAIAIAFTEKDASDAKDVTADTIAFSHKYGSAITMNVSRNSDGNYEVVESAFHHSASDKVGGNAGGILQLKDVSVANGVMSGEVYTNADAEMFGAKIDVDLKFKVALPK